MNKFGHLDNADSARKFLVDQFAASTEQQWKWKKTDEKDGITIRVFEGPMKISAAVVYNPYAEDEQCALILDTTGNYDINKFDPSKFENRVLTEEEQKEKMLRSMGVDASEKQEEQMEEMEEVQEEQEIPEERKLTQEEREQAEQAAEDIMLNHNLGVLDVWIILKKGSEDHKEEIVGDLKEIGATYVLTEVTQELLSGSDEFNAVNKKKQDAVRNLAIECISDDVPMVRIKLGEYIAQIYRKV